MTDLAERAPAPFDAGAVDVPTAVVDLAAFAHGVAGVGRFLDAEGEAELAAARAAGLAERLVVRHGVPRGAAPSGRVVVGSAEALRALERTAAVCHPVEVVLHAGEPGRGTGGFDPERPGLVEALRTVLASPRLSFGGLYLRTPGESADVLRACRAGVEVASALPQRLPGFAVRTLLVRREGTSGSPVDAAALAELARREVRLHSAALGSVAPHLYVDAGPDSAPLCHEVSHRVVATSASAVVLDAAADTLAGSCPAGVARVTPVGRTGVSVAPVVPPAERLVTRELTTADGRLIVAGLRVPAGTRPGDVLTVPLIGRTLLAVPSRYRLVTLDGAELLAGLAVRPSAHPQLPRRVG